jgi:Zn-dependent metalloprotease
MLGNIFFSFTYIDETSQTFQDWISMVGGLFENMGIEKTDLNTHKTVLAFLTGGLLPIISLTSLHFFTKYDRNKSDDKEEIQEIPTTTKPDEDITEEEYREIVQDYIRKQKEQDEKLKYTPTEEDFKKLDEFLRNVSYNGPVKEDNDYNKFNPNQEELEKIEEVLSQFSKSETIEIKEEDEVEKVFFEPIEDIVEEKEEVIENIVEIKEETVEDILTEESQEVKPEPIDDKKTYKVLNYFK